MSQLFREFVIMIAAAMIRKLGLMSAKGKVNGLSK